jgi:hypothetical protein
MYTGSTTTINTAQIANNLQQMNDRYSDVARTAADQMSKAENTLVNLHAQYGTATTDQERKDLEAQIAGEEVRYRRVARFFELTSTLIRNAHEIAQRALQNLSLR